jgi:hypothetical protein
MNPPISSVHRLRLGLPGYLILFAPLALEPQRQYVARRPPTLLVFFQISTHSTATPGIPSPSPLLKRSSLESELGVKPPDYTSDLPPRLHSLYAQ